MDFDVTVGTWGLRAALLAVVAHVEPDPDVPARHRVRLYVTEDGVAASATDGYTAGLASVGVEDQAPETGCFDLAPEDVKKVLQLFRPRKEETQARLRLQWSEKQLLVTDVSGMFPGQQLRLIPPAVDVRFPNVAGLVTMAWQMRFGGDPSPYMPVAGEYLARFHAASKAMGFPLVLQPTARGRAVVISCGPDFLGALMPRRADAGDEDEWEGQRKAWAARSASVSAVHPAPAREIRVPDAAGSSVQWRPAGSDEWRTVDLDVLLGDQDDDGGDGDAAAGSGDDSVDGGES